MKTDAIVDIKSFKNDELTIKANNEADRIRLAQYVQHRRDVYKKNVSAGKNPNYPLIMLNLSDKHKKRTTGKDSQNNKFHGLVEIITRETGNDFETVKQEIKRKAMLELGYPKMKDSSDREIWIVENDRMIEPIPQRSRDCTTVEMSLLIDSAYLLGADLGIILP